MNMGKGLPFRDEFLNRSCGYAARFSCSHPNNLSQCFVNQIHSMKILILILALVIGVYSQTDADKPRNVKPELKEAYKKWLDTDVCVFISRDPRDAYLKLQTDEERDKFVEDYWNKREAAPLNDFSNDRYERTAYADEHFTSAITGSKTDRGRVCILWGKPEKIERGQMRIAGREDEIPFEKWRCDGLEFIFIDPEKTGDLRLIKDEEKVRK